jgi:hypothetical protein
MPAVLGRHHGSLSRPDVFRSGEPQLVWVSDVVVVTGLGTVVCSVVVVVTGLGAVVLSVVVVVTGLGTVVSAFVVVVLFVGSAFSFIVEQADSDIMAAARHGIIRRFISITVVGIITLQSELTPSVDHILWGVTRMALR